MIGETVPRPDPEPPDPELSDPEQSDPEQSEPEDGPAAPAAEIGGRAGPDPTRYGDWEKNGRCIDF